jgi:molybdenum cofactor guanylyltransferase
MDPSQPQPSLTILILAGGASRRMGQDKAAVLYEGLPLLSRVCTIALQVAVEPSDRVIVLSRSDQDHGPLLPPHCDLWQEPRATDPAAPPAGPLQALAWAWPQIPSDWILLLACDLPNLDADRLTQARKHLPQTPASAYIPRHPQGWEPLCAFYRSDLAANLSDFVAQGGRSFQHWITGLIDQDPTDRSVQIWNLPSEMLHNCNHPEDLGPKI